jgi:hypothetical protein
MVLHRRRHQNHPVYHHKKDDTLPNFSGDFVAYEVSSEEAFSPLS